MPINVTFDTPPIPPSSTDKTNFRLRYDAFLAFIQSLGAKLITFVTQINALETNMITKEASAVAASDIAVGAANYQGDWVANSYSKGQSVSLNGIRYISKVNLNTDTPPSTNWQKIGTAAEIADVIHAATAEVPGDTDEFGYWDSLTGLFRKVTFANFATYFAKLVSPAFTGIPTAPTAAAGTNTTQLATTAFVQGEGFSKLGVGQTWQDVTASRAFGTTYTNTTGKPIYVFVAGTIQAGATTRISLYVSGIEVTYFNTTGGSFSLPWVCGIIPNGAQYYVTQASSSVVKWTELR